MEAEIDNFRPHIPDFILKLHSILEVGSGLI